MNKTEFIKALANQANLSLKDAQAAVDGFIEVVAEALKEGDKVAISGLGTFELKEKAARKGINPLTKEEIMIPASKSPSLKVGRLFKDFMPLVRADFLDSDLEAADRNTATFHSRRTTSYLPLFAKSSASSERRQYCCFSLHW